MGVLKKGISGGPASRDSSFIQILHEVRRYLVPRIRPTC